MNWGTGIWGVDIWGADNAHDFVVTLDRDMEITLYAVEEN